MRVPKTRNAGTMTESAFWGWIRSSLRQRSRFWKPINKAKDMAKRKYTGPNKRQKFEYQCNACKNWFKGDEVQVDHIKEVGTLTCADDLPAFIDGLFCEIEGLQVLCSECHNSKTQSYLSEQRSKKQRTKKNG